MQQQQTTAPASGRQVTAVRPAQTRAELDALQMRRSELKNQLESVTERSTELTDQLKEADGNAARSLEARLNSLDARSALLERDLMQTDDAITDALARGITTSQQRSDLITIQRSTGNTGEVVASAMFAEGLAFVLLGVLLYRRMRNRGVIPAARLAPEEAARMEQLQRAVDVIAVEVERISEGQRYVSKLLSEKPAIAEKARQA